MWAHRPWVGRWLPVGTAPGHELEPYSRLVNAVEGNTTFYASPAPPTVARWIEQADPGFRFVFKVPRTITHDQRLRDVDGVLGPFLDLLEPLAPHIGSLTFQLPASFAPVDLPVLDSVLAGLPRSPWRWSVELRHPAFFEGAERDEVDAVLGRHEVERVLMDTRPLFSRPPMTEAGRETWGRKPRVPALTDAITDEPIVRFIGSDHLDTTRAGLQEWEPIITDWLHEGRTPTVFVHTPDNFDSPALARGLHDRVCSLVPELEPLPEPWPVVAAEQGSLF
ncbi:MAG: DUF72 domain-containing protein [Actinobacteria bacterium]|nr:DUF72 domain-containing protein [Actinomycetota bacterium]